MLFEYQQEAALKVLAHLHNRRHTILQLPTGGGKTITAASVAEAYDRPLLWLAHTRELVHQARARLEASGVKDISVMSIPGLLAARSKPQAALLVLDECHHAAAATWRRAIELYPDAVRLGLTATPERADGQPLGDLFDEMVCGASEQDMIDLGRLVPLQIMGPSERTADLAQDPIELLHKIQEPALVFCRTARQATEYAAAFPDVGLLLGRTAKRTRDSIVEDFKIGKLRAICSVGALTEGFDAPRASVGIVARGVSHFGTWRQIAGRIVRAHPGKNSSILYDLQGSVHRLGLPLEPIEWSLHKKTRLHKPKEQYPVTQCERCYRIWRRTGANATICPGCGNTIPPLPAPKVSKRKLGIILRPNADLAEQQANWKRWCKEARARGYKIGWAYVKFRSVYGGAPPK